MNSVLYELVDSQKQRTRLPQSSVGLLEREQTWAHVQWTVQQVVMTGVVTEVWEQLVEDMT